MLPPAGQMQHSCAPYDLLAFNYKLPWHRLGQPAGHVGDSRNGRILRVVSVQDALDEAFFAVLCFLRHERLWTSLRESLWRLRKWDLRTWLI